MLGKEDWMYIKSQRERGVYQKDIAVALGVHPRTVRRALKRGGPSSRKRPGARGSKLDPFKPAIDRLLSEGVWNAVVIFREIQQHGYQGEITLVRDYIRPKRSVRKSRMTVRFETPPGRQTQSDWGEIWTRVGERRLKVPFLVSTLGYSRRFFFWATDRQDAEHTYEGIIRAFEHFGGVTREVLVDNQKATVISHRIGGQVRFNERFLDLAGHYGFVPRACRPYRARTKGKDERMVGYIKGNFFQRYRRFEHLAHLNQLAVKWLSQEADQRVQATVKQVVAERFGHEAPFLAPLPRVRYDTSYHQRRWVGWDGYIEVCGNRYSVPSRLCGSQVTIRLSLDGVLSVSAEGIKVAEHRLRPVKEGWATIPAHHRQLWTETLQVERRDLSIYQEVL
jgi:transposase